MSERSFKKSNNGNISLDYSTTTFENKNTKKTPVPNELRAVRIIERCWCSYRDRQMFRLLKHSVCAAEHSMSSEIIKRIAPNESYLLNDPCLSVRIKFRFCGEEFPPYIVFKIYSHTKNGSTSKYLNLTDLPKQNIFYDLLDYATNKRLSKKLKREIPSLLVKPITQEVQLKQMEILSKLDSKGSVGFDESMNISIDGSMSTSKTHFKNSKFKDTIYSSKTSSRRSRNAIAKMNRMKKVYSDASLVARSETLTASELDAEIASTSYMLQRQRQTNVPSHLRSFQHNTFGDGQLQLETSTMMHNDETNADLRDDFEDEVSNLYIWAQNLSVNDDYLNSPRLASNK